MNQKKSSTASFLITGGAFLAFALISTVWKLIYALRAAKYADVSSIGIIGGADGPTAEFLIDRLKWEVFGITERAAVFVGAVLLLLGIILLVRDRRNKKSDK